MFILATDVCESVPNDLFNIVSTIITLIKIGVPLLLIIFGMLDLGKAVVAQKEDEIKKGQQTFIKRIVAAILVFFVIAIVELVVGIAAGTSSETIMGCVDKFINGQN